MSNPNLPSLDHLTYAMMHLVSQTDACENITFARFATRTVLYLVLQALSTDSRTVRCKPCRPPMVWSLHTDDSQWTETPTAQNQRCCHLWTPRCHSSSWCRPTYLCYCEISIKVHSLQIIQCILINYRGSKFLGNNFLSLKYSFRNTYGKDFFLHKTWSSYLWLIAIFYTAAK